MYARTDTLFSADEYLVADAGYPLKTFCITPFRDNGHLTPQQKNFNKGVSRTRISVERAFGRLKNRFGAAWPIAIPLIALAFRWQCLKYLHCDTVERSVYFVHACFLLHNVCETLGDHLLLGDDQPDDDVPEQAVFPAENAANIRRQQLLMIFPEQ